MGIIEWVGGRASKDSGQRNTAWQGDFPGPFVVGNLFSTAKYKDSLSPSLSRIHCESQRIEATETL